MSKKSNDEIMIGVVKSFWRWIANLAVVLFLCFTILWINVAIELIPKHPKWIALGYIPPFWFILFLLPPIIIYLFFRYYKRVIALLLVYLLVFISFGDTSLVKQKSFTFPKNSSTQKLSIVALNLRYYSFGFNEIVAAINDMKADIYLLSENRIKPEQIAALREKVAPKLFYMGQQESTAIISRYPVVSFNEVNFPTRQASLHKGNKLEKIHLNPFRSFAHAVIDVNGTNVHAISVRFIAGRSRHKTLPSIVNWGFYVLEAQQKEIAFFLDYLKKLEGPVIFGGDLNATPSSAVVKKLAEISTDLYLYDHLWGGFTFGTSFPPMTNIPSARLDYLFAMNQVQPQYSKMLDVVISDHYPVFAEVLIPLEKKARETSSLTSNAL
ncbi:MAG: endonuclease/exonuclease/phosphatase family protein [Proteobacteria bacterium]|nr:endonuclease/exonuclease/phosphatase family protein [Pseudomonadota bacterium]